MKKLIIAVLAVFVLAPMFTSCDKGENKCYHVSYIVPGHQGPDGEMIESAAYECYKWINEDDLDIYKDELKDLGYTDIKVVSVNDIDEGYRNKTMADCTMTE